MKGFLLFLLAILGASAFPSRSGHAHHRRNMTHGDISPADDKAGVRRGAPYRWLEAQKWPTDKVISYSIAAGYPADFASKIRDTFKFYTDNTCLTYQENGPTLPLLTVVQDEDGCFSSVGRNTGLTTKTQILNLSEGCEDSGAIDHEVAHSIGLGHTQSRHDRDQYITINFTNVDPEEHYNYKKYEEQYNNNFGVEYDYRSIMHYKPYGLALDENIPVIVAKDPDAQGSIGQRNYGERLGFSDLKLINAIYECAKKCASPSVVCQNGGIINSKTCNTCICPRMFTGADCSRRHPGIGWNASSPICGADLTASSSWQKATGSFGVYDEEYPENRSECYWIIKAPAGRKIEVRLNKGDIYCERKECLYQGIELFMRGPVYGGYSHCCADKYVGRVFQSRDNLFAIGVHSIWSTPKIDIDYRLV